LFGSVSVVGAVRTIVNNESLVSKKDGALASETRSLQEVEAIAGTVHG
jgi:hypothetical protein